MLGRFLNASLYPIFNQQGAGCSKLSVKTSEYYAQYVKNSQKRHQSTANKKRYIIVITMFKSRDKTSKTMSKLTCFR